MNRKKWWTYGIFIGLTEAVGALSGFMTRNGMKEISGMPQSVLTPPSIVFPIVWGILYALLGIGAARVWLAPDSRERSKGLWLFVFQLIFNFFWSLIYFNMQRFGFALLWLIALWILILLMTISFRKTDKAAGWLQLPYLLWVAFAGYLNFVMWRIN